MVAEGSIVKQCCDLSVCLCVCLSHALAHKRSILGLWLLYSTNKKQLRKHSLGGSTVDMPRSDCHHQGLEAISFRRAISCFSIELFNSRDELTIISSSNYCECVSVALVLYLVTLGVKLFHFSQ